jgi:hypothetical protein
VERTKFLEWYKGYKTELFDNKRVIEAYCQNDVTVPRQACQVFRRDLMAIGNIEVYLEYIMIAFACNRLLRKRYHRTNSHRGYTGNLDYTKKALIWLVYREQTDGCKILHCGNGGE